MNLFVDRVEHKCGEVEVDVTFGADVFRLTKDAALALGAGLQEAAR